MVGVWGDKGQRQTDISLTLANMDCYSRHFCHGQIVQGRQTFFTRGNDPMRRRF